MRDVLGPGTILGYCTNVHAGADWPTTKTNLDQYSASVKRIVSPNQPMGVGLWLAADAARELLTGNRIQDLRDCLENNGLMPFTFNGFPYGNFHEPVVKHKVYEPDWRDPRRLQYTCDLARILSALIDEGEEGSISTLPIGWYAPFLDFDEQQTAATHLRTLVDRLARIESETGRLIHVDLEPEPLCALESPVDVVRFFEAHLLGSANDERIRRHLRVCHDVCHAAVVFDAQESALNQYRRAGLRVGKVQISSAIRVDFRRFTDAKRQRAIEELSRFSEDRYLHQTMVWEGDGGGLSEDLSGVLAARSRQHSIGDEWRVHFHIPIYLEEFGLLQTTRDEISRCLHAIRPSDEIHHFEVETYAWNVLPPELQVDNLSEGIARELQWVRDLASSMRPE